MSDVKKYSHVCKSCYTPTLLNKYQGWDNFLPRLINVFFDLISGQLGSEPICQACNKKALISVNTPRALKIMKDIGFIADD